MRWMPTREVGDDKPACSRNRNCLNKRNYNIKGAKDRDLPCTGAPRDELERRQLSTCVLPAVVQACLTGQACARPANSSQLKHSTDTLVDIRPSLVLGPPAQPARINTG
jgi:hypothetical protein